MEKGYQILVSELEAEKAEKTAFLESLEKLIDEAMEA